MRKEAARRQDRAGEEPIPETTPMYGFNRQLKNNVVIKTEFPGPNDLATGCKGVMHIFYEAWWSL